MPLIVTVDSVILDYSPFMTGSNGIIGNAIDKGAVGPRLILGRGTTSVEEVINASLGSQCGRAVPRLVGPYKYIVSGGKVYMPSVSRFSEAALVRRAAEISHAARRHLSYTQRTPSSPYG